MRLLVFLLLGALLAGCTSPDADAPATPTQGTAAPTSPAANGTSTFETDIDFSTDPNGVSGEEPLTFPAAARTLEFSVTWTSTAPVASTRDLRLALVDPTGAEAANCDLGTNGVTQTEGRACGPSTNSIVPGEYKLTWSGFGSVSAHVTVTTS